MLTGHHAVSLGLVQPSVDANERRLAEAVNILPERLQEKGWYTVGVTANFNLNMATGLAQGFDIYRDYFRGRDDLRNGVEELQFSEAPWLVAPFAFGENRFAILRAEAVLPNQGAGYTYAD